MSSSRDHRKQLYERLVGQPVASERFVITSLLGFGGMGAVYEALQKNMGRKVALKLIPTHDPTIVARFEREAHTISKLRHPNTITVFDFGQSEDGFLYLSMELLHGKTLTEEIKAGPMEPVRAVHIASQMCRSLAEAHSAGIVHRDIKPDNIILIRVDDDHNVVKVLDFGIAKAVMGEDDVQLTGDGRIIGTPRYMSPEQILAEPLDHRSDIYSLGCILFEMLCGAPPFQQSSTTALMISHTQDPPPAFAAQLDVSMLSAMPGGLERVVRRALAKSPHDRPDDCDQLREELEAAMAGLAEDDQDSFETVGAMPLTTGSRALNTSTGPLPAPAGTSDASAVTPAAAKSSTGLIVGIGVLVAVILAMVGWRMTLGGDAAPVDEPQPIVVEKPVAPDPEPPEPEDEEVAVIAPVEAGVAVAILKIDTSPTGARLYEGESLLGRTPISIPVAAELNKHTYRLVLKDHDELVVTVPVSARNKDEEVIREFELKPTKKRSPSNVKIKRPTPPTNVEPTPTVEPKGPPDVKLLGDGPTAEVPRLE